MFQKPLLPILILAVLLIYRIFIFFSHPDELFPQEALLGYRAQYLIQQHTDELNRPTPIIFSSVYGYSGPLPSYLVAGSVNIFGLNSSAIRLPFLLISFIGLTALWLTVRKFYPKQPALAWWSVFVLGLSPVHTAISLSPSEWFLNFNLVLIFWAALLYLKKKLKIIFAFLAIVFLIIFAINLNLEKSQITRVVSEQINFTTDISILNSINQMRGEGSFFHPSTFWSRLFYNKSYTINSLISNFFNHLKPQFYFAQAGRSSDYAATNFGLFLTALIIPFLYGIKRLSKDSGKNKLIWGLIFLFGISPSVFSLPSPHLEKMILALIPITVIIALGLQQITHKWKFLILCITLIHYTMFAYDHTFKEPERTHKSRCSGVEQLANYISKNLDQFSKIFVSDAYCPQVGVQLAYHLTTQDIPQQISPSNTPQYKFTISETNQFSITNQSNWKIDFIQPSLLILDLETPNNIFDRYHINPTSTDNSPCFKQLTAVSNPYHKEIYQIYQTTNPDCVPVINEI